MARVKGGRVTERRKKALKDAKGYFGSKHKLYNTAREQVRHSLMYAYRDRRQKKRDFRKLWITRINAACRNNGISYSKFINGLSKANVSINRKMLSEIAIDDPEMFTRLVNVSKDALEGKEIKQVPIKEEKKEVSNAKKEVSNTKKEVKASKPKTDLSKMTLAELKALAKKKKISGYSTMKKSELIDALK